MKSNESSTLEQSSDHLFHDRHSRKGVLVCFLLSGLFFSFLGLNRFLAADEGFYLLAAKEVYFGRDLYLDFFYPQMPLFPYFYGLFLKVIGYSWEIARLIAALISCGCAVLLYLRLKALRAPFFIIFGLALFLGSGLVLSWFPTAKTYSLSTLFLLIAYLSIKRTFSLPPFFSFFLGGLFIGLAVNTRLFYCITIPFFLFDIILCHRKNALRPVLFFLLGGVATYLPHLYYIVHDSSAYWFNNVGYHLVRSHRSAELDEIARNTIYNILFAFQPDERMDGFQFPMLFYVTCFSGIYSLIAHRFLSLATMIGLSLFAMSLSPDPIHLQYFSTVVPFFILGTCESLAKGKELKKWVFLLLLLFSVEYLRHTPDAIYRSTTSGIGVKGVEEGKEHLSQISIASYVGYALDKHTDSGELVLAQWPGYLLESHARIYPGMENQFWIRISHKLTEEERKDYHLFTREELWKEILRPNLSTVVIDQRKVSRYFPRKRLQQAGYVVVENVHGVLIWKKQPGKD